MIWKKTHHEIMDSHKKQRTGTSRKCDEALKILINEVSDGKSNNGLISYRAIRNYLKPGAIIYSDARDVLEEYVRIVLKLAYSQLSGTKGNIIRVSHIEKAFTKAALLVSLDNNKTMWEITRK